MGVQLEVNRALRIGSRIGGSTSGSVLFVGSNLELAEDNANFNWDDGNNALTIGNINIGTNTISSLDTNGDILLSPNGTGKVGIGTVSPIGLLHISNGESGQTSPSTSADELIIENSTNAGMTILTPSSNTGSIFFGDENGNQPGKIQYNHSGNLLSFDTQGATRLTINNVSNFKMSTGTLSGAAADSVQLASQDWNGAGTAALFIRGEENVDYIFGSVFTRSGGLNVKTTRTTTTATLDATNYDVPCDTDGGAFTVTLEAGVAGTVHRISNTGTSANNLTIAPDGAELLIGVNSNFTLFDGESLTIIYEGSEGWN